MNDPLDVNAIRGTESGWLGDAETLARAVALIQKVGPGEYFVFSQTTERNKFYLVDPDGQLSLVEKQSDALQ